MPTSRERALSRRGRRVSSRSSPERRNSHGSSPHSSSRRKQSSRSAFRGEEPTTESFNSTSHRLRGRDMEKSQFQAFLTCRPRCSVRSRVGVDLASSPLPARDGFASAPGARATLTCLLLSLLGEADLSGSDEANLIPGRHPPRPDHPPSLAVYIPREVPMRHPWSVAVLVVLGAVAGYAAGTRPLQAQTPTETHCRS